MRRRRRRAFESRRRHRSCLSSQLARFFYRTHTHASPPKIPPRPQRPAAVLELERQDPSSFQPLPFHYQELAHALFTGGVADALPREVFGDEAGRVRDLVNLVQKTRAAKVLAGLGMMTEAAAVKLNNLSAMELNSVRAFFCGALDQFHRCARIAEAGVGGGGGGGAAEAGGEGEGEGEKPARQLRRVRG